MGLSAIFAGIFLSWVVGARVEQKTHDIERAMDAVAKGDLTHLPMIEGKDTAVRMAMMMTTASSSASVNPRRA